MEWSESKSGHTPIYGGRDLTDPTITRMKVRIAMDMLNVRGGLIPLASQNRMSMGKHKKETPEDIWNPANNVQTIIPPMSLTGWIRQGMTEYLRSEGLSSCHGFLSETATVSGADRNKAAADDLERGYHLKASCLKETKEPCVMYTLFGSFAGNPRLVMFEPVKVSPVKADWRGNRSGVTGHGNYRIVTTAPRSCDGVPFLPAENEFLTNIDAIMTIRPYKALYGKMPIELAIGLFRKTFSFLNENRFNLNHQLGGSRTSGFGVVFSDFINPFYDEVEVRKFQEAAMLKDKAEDYGDEDGGMSDNTSDEKKKPTEAMLEKDGHWQELIKNCDATLNEYLEDWRTKFGLESAKAWPSTTKALAKYSKAAKAAEGKDTDGNGGGDEDQG